MFSLIPTPYNWIAAAVLALALVGGGAYAGHYVTKNADTVAYQKLQLADANAKTASVAASLNQLQTFIGTMNAAGADYTAELDAINAQFATLKTEFKNATLHPLPADCKPDAGRLHVLTDAVAAANAHSSPSK